MMKLNKSWLHGRKYNQLNLNYNYVPELMRSCIAYFGIDVFAGAAFFENIRTWTFSGLEDIDGPPFYRGLPTRGISL